MNTSRPGRRGALVAGAALVVVSMLLGACSSGGATADAERAAAALSSDVDSTEPDSTEPDSTEPEATPEEPTTELQESLTDQDGADPEPVQSVYRGVRVCVINARLLERRPLPRLNVIFTKADRVSKEQSVVAPGDRICGEAAYSTAREDVTGEIFMMYEEEMPMKFKANNAYVGSSAQIGWNFAKPPCAYVSAEPETKVYDNGEVRFTLQRLNDSKDLKEFTITVAESQGANYDCS